MPDWLCRNSVAASAPRQECDGARIAGSWTGHLGIQPYPSFDPPTPYTTESVGVYFSHNCSAKVTQNPAVSPPKRKGTILTISAPSPVCVLSTERWQIIEADWDVSWISRIRSLKCGQGAGRACQPLSQSCNQAARSHNMFSTLSACQAIRMQ